MARTKTNTDPAAADEATESPTPTRGKKRKLIVIGLVVALLVGAGSFVKLRGTASADAKPEPGAVMSLQPVTVNLSDGHYLRVGLALQVVKGKTLGGDTEGADPSVGGAKALDQLINVFGDATMPSLLGAGRREAKQVLVHRLQRAYDGAVMDVYFTEFVMQ